MTRHAEQEAEARRQLVARCAELIAIRDDPAAFALKLGAVMERGELWRAARHARVKSWEGAA